jgi:hypothetical protein
LLDLLALDGLEGVDASPGRGRGVGVLTGHEWHFLCHLPPNNPPEHTLPHSLCSFVLLRPMLNWYVNEQLYARLGVSTQRIAQPVGGVFQAIEQNIVRQSPVEQWMRRKHSASLGTVSHCQGGFARRGLTYQFSVLPVPNSAADTGRYQASNIVF